MTWYRARVGALCGSCNQRQPALAPMRRLQTGRSRCAACAKRLLGEDVPGDLADSERHLAPPAKPKTNAQPLQPFVERLRQWLAQMDGKAKAAGGDA